MLKIQVIIYQKANGKSPLINWLKRQNQRVQEKARELGRRLKDEGHDLGMPYAKFLRDDIWELRVVVQRVQHRILYTFVGENIALLTNGLTKEDVVPPREIDKAVEFRNDYLEDRNKHTYRVY